MIPLSVVIPVHNRAAMVVEAIESVRNQSVPADEIIVVDDGSTDGSGEAAGALPGVSVVRQERRGVSAARNAGIAAAGNGTIAFLDSDDLWSPDKIDIQWRYMQGRPRLLLSHTDEIWIRRGRRVNRRKGHEKHGGSIFTECLATCFIAASTVMVRKELFDRVGLFDESFPACEDYEFWLRVAGRFEIGYVDRLLATRREGHEGQLSHAVPYLDTYRIEAILKLFGAGLLSEEQIEAASRELEKKTGILLAGLERKGLRQDAERWKKRVEETLARGGKPKK